MGDGIYSISARAARSEEKGYTTKPLHQIFESRRINEAMNPHGIRLRESRDSEEHPLSFPIIIALDLTGSMGDVPHKLVKDGLPTIMSHIIQAGIEHPQVLFLGVGDHEFDSAPLQVGQFESSDDKLDYWLTSTYLEGGGGGNPGESYHLAWFFVSKFTASDSFEKRGKKGIMFTIGDEPVLPYLPARAQSKLMGEGQFQEETAASLLKAAQEQYEVFHIHTTQTGTGSRPRSYEGWKQLMNERLIVVDSTDGIIDAIIRTTLTYGSAVEGKPAEQAIVAPAADLVPPTPISKPSSDELL